MSFKINFKNSYFFSLLFLLFLTLISCNYKKGNKNLPDLAALFENTDNKDQRKSKIVQSLNLSWEDKLDLIREDKGAIKINTIGLYLESFEMIKEKDFKLFDYESIMPVYLNKKEAMNSFKIIKLDTLNKQEKNYLIMRNSILEEKNSKIIDYYSDARISKDIKKYYVLLNWKYENETYSTTALFIGNNFIYDQVISNLRNNISKSTKSDSKNINYKNNIAPITCDTISKDKSIVYFQKISMSLYDIFGTGTSASANINIEGKLDAENCIKYLQTRNHDIKAYSDFGYSNDARVKVIDFLPTSTENTGYCEYEIAVAVGTKDNLTWSWENNSFKLSSSGYGSSTTKRSSSYIIPKLLN